MANWKKVIVSQSNAALLSLTASAVYPLKLSGIGHNGSNQNPLVIDVNGNVQTGSEYATKYGDDIVSASGNLTSNVVTVGNNGSGIQNATSTTDANFNSADVYGVVNMTASAYHLNGDRQFAIGSSDSGVILGDTDTKLYLTGSGLILSSSGGITASILPTVSKPPFYVGTNAEGNLIKVATGNDSNSSILGVDAGDNIVIDGFSTNEEIAFAVSTAVIDNAFTITGSNSNIQNSQVLAANDKIIIKYGDGTQEAVRTVLEFTQSVEGDTNLFGIKLTEAITGGISALARQDIFKQVSTSTGVPVISLSDTIFITGSITSSGDLQFSASYNATSLDNSHSIHPAGWGTTNVQTLNISASNISASTVNADTFFLSTFAFSSNTALVTSASTTFGDEAAVDSHQFTGSVHISGGLNILQVGSATGATFNVSSSIGAATHSIENLVTNQASATASIGVLTTAAADATASIGHLITSASDATSSITSLVTNQAYATASIGHLITSASDATASIASLITTVSGIKSFPYDGGDTVGTDQAIITGSLLVGDTINSTGAGAGHITASGHISASAVTASNIHVATNLHVGGNLTVLGSNTVINSTNLHVEDRFILLGSGSGDASGTVLDTGIIFESGSSGNGLGLFYDATAKRISIGKNINDTYISSNAENIEGVGGQNVDGTIAGNVVTVRNLTSTAGTNLTDTVGTGDTDVQFGVGEMVVDSSDDIWIYTG